MNIKKIFLLCLFSIFCLIPVVGAADKDITVKSVSAVDATKEVKFNSIKEVDVLFNDLGQYAEYEVVLKNNSDKDLYLNSLTVTNSSEKFIKYSLDAEDIGTEIDANSTKKVKFLIKTTSIDKAGKNVDDEVKLKLSFGETIKVINPETNNNVIEIILSIVLVGVVLFMIFSKTNKKTKLSVLVISLVVFGTTSVLADDEITVKFDGSVSYKSQVLMETTGTTLNDNVVNYGSSKDVWAYYNKVKNIYIKSDNSVINKYYKKFDLTVNNKNKVIGYLVENNDKKVPYDLYIIGNGVIYANEDSTGLFSFPNVEKIEGLDNVIFDKTIVYKGMFIGDEKLTSVDVSNLDLSNATDVSYMFYKADNVGVDTESLNLENVEVQNNMFTTYLYDTVKKDATIDIGNDFNNISTGKFVMNDTLSNKYPIYYYRGSVENNYVKFGGYCWRIVRTTDTGGVKLVYFDKVNTRGGCGENYKSSTGGIGNSVYNENGEVVSHVGYMYGDVYDINHIDLSTQNETYVYGNSVTWDGTKYTLNDTMTSVNWKNDYQKIAEKYHYTCFNSTGECSSVNYIVFVGDFYSNENPIYTTDDAHYFVFKNGINLKTAKDAMFKNTNSSTVKMAVDSWYESNMTAYTSFLEDTVWCNDRELVSGALFSENNSALEYSYFAAQKRLDEQNVPQLSCKNNNDKFTVSSDTGNGALTYPIGLLTADEMVISGVVEYNNYSSNTNSYLYNIGDMWSMTPHLYNRAENVFLYHGYSLGTRNVKNTYSVVPAISLKSGVDYLSGNGYMQQPYVINTN